MLSRNSCTCIYIDHISKCSWIYTESHMGCVALGSCLLFRHNLHFPQIVSQWREVPGIEVNQAQFKIHSLNREVFLFQYAIRSTFLGFTFASSILLAVLSPLKWKAFGVYGTVMSIFHYSEFLAIAWSNPSSLSTSSFILNHSLHYALAAISSWIEFLVEVNFWPEIKEYWQVTIVGVVLCLGGELLRKLAIITANTNFNHIVSWSVVLGMRSEGIQLAINLFLQGKLTCLKHQFGSSFNFNIFGKNLIRSLDAIFRFNLRKATIINLLKMVFTLWFVTPRMSDGFGGQSERR